MISLLILFHRIISKLILDFDKVRSKIGVRYLLLVNRVDYGKNLISNGMPVISVRRTRGEFSIGDNFKMNNGKRYNQIGRQQPCFLIVFDGILTIGNNVSMSGTAIFCAHKISIGNNVKIGGGNVIYDSDFHSLNYKDRLMKKEDRSLIKKCPVMIGNNVFIGAHSMILKGVTIGDNSIVGAGSVVSRSIPENQIWAGNPAVFIREI